MQTALDRTAKSVPAETLGNAYRSHVEPSHPVPTEASFETQPKHDDEIGGETSTWPSVRSPVGRR